MIRVLVVAVLLLSSGVAQAALPSAWWRHPGSLSRYDARWRHAFRIHEENKDSFAGALAHGLKTGKSFAYLEQGGVSPSWYHPPLRLPLYSGRYDARLYRLAYRAFVQAHRLTHAYRLTLTAVHQRPESAFWRRRLIRVARWLGQRFVVLQQDQWLARHGDRAALQHVLELAGSLPYPGLVVYDLAARGRVAALTSYEWRILLAAYGRLGKPRHALAVIASALRRRPTRYLLREEAGIAVQLGDVNLALKALGTIGARYGFTPRIAVQEANLLSLRGQESTAFSILRASRAKATLNDVPFWHLYAVLAWDKGDRTQALQAEKMLYLLGAADQYDLQRLIALTRRNDAVAALSVALLGWRRFRLPLFFFEGAELAIRDADWPALAYLLRDAAQHRRLHLRQYMAYWVAAAHLAAALRYPYAAAVDYARAFALNRGDPAVASDLLWTLVDHKETADMRALFAVPVRYPSRLRAVVASAAQVMHRSEGSTIRLQAALPPQIVLEEADRLAGRGIPGAAWMLRREVVRRMTARLWRLASHRVAP